MHIYGENIWGNNDKYQYFNDYTGFKNSWSDDDEEASGWTDAFRACLKELKDTSPMITPVVTYFLIIANILLFIFTIGRMYRDPWSVGISPIEFLNNPFDQRVLLSIFTHAGLFHLLGNMTFLYIAGDNIEAVMGRFKYLLFYLLTGYLAIASQSLYTITFASDPVSLATPMVGASGAIAGLLGAYLYFYPSAYKYQCFCLRFICYCFKMLMKYWIALWIIYQFILPLIEPNVAVFAHLGGFLAGLSLAPLFTSRSAVEKIKKEFLEGKYRGIRPVKEFVKTHTFGRSGYFIAGLVVIAVLVVTLFSLQCVMGQRNLYNGSIKFVHIDIDLYMDHYDYTTIRRYHIEHYTMHVIISNNKVVYMGGGGEYKDYGLKVAEKLASSGKDSYSETFNIRPFYMFYGSTYELVVKARITNNCCINKSWVLVFSIIYALLISICLCSLRIQKIYEII